MCRFKRAKAILFICTAFFAIGFVALLFVAMIYSSPSGNSEKTIIEAGGALKALIGVEIFLLLAATGALINYQDAYKGRHKVRKGSC